jgi:hypothetical protein
MDIGQVIVITIIGAVLLGVFVVAAAILQGVLSRKGE